MTISQAQKDPGILQTVLLLTAYGFDLRGGNPVQVINRWQADFSALWIRLAVIEALYLGRYKAISVEHLLKFWNKKGQPNFHFSAEFERMVSHNLSRALTVTGDESMEESAGKLDKGSGLKVPPTVQNSSPEKKLAEPFKEDLLTLSRGSRSSQPSETNTLAPAKTSRSPLPTQSIEQFIPITAESDILSRLRSILGQETENV